MTTPLILAMLAGLGAGSSIIIAVGAQNAFVLRQGIRREHVLLVVAICAASDLLLITLGVAGVGVIAGTAPLVLTIIRWAGALFLAAYGILAARRVFNPKPLVPAAETARVSAAVIAASCLAFTFLNPAVYLDTLVLLGSIANTHGLAGRWYFAAGAGLASILWFSALGFGARLLTGFFAKPIAWRILDAIIAVVMITLAVNLVVTR